MRFLNIMGIHEMNSQYKTALYIKQINRTVLIRRLSISLCQLDENNLWTFQ